MSVAHLGRTGVSIAPSPFTSHTHLRSRAILPLRRSRLARSSPSSPVRGCPAAAAASAAPPLASLSPDMLLLAAAGAVAAWAAWTIFRFLRADADLTLLSKRPPPSGAWQGKVVWIVGASQGLGEALALHWAAAGAKLILSSRSLEKLRGVRERCLRHIPEEDVLLLPLDLVGDSDGLEAAAAAAFGAFGGAGVDYLVHNAGASQHAAAEDTSPEVAAALLRLNLQGPLALARAALPHMAAARRGRHVVVASMSAVVPSPGQAVYSAAKSGLHAYFASVASELSDRGVGATLCCPGPLATGQEGKPRMVYGADGLILHAATGMSKKRVSAERAAELIARAAWHGLDEVWIANHPVLLLGYLMQYLPWLGMLALKRVGPARARALRDGKSGYDMAALLRDGDSGGAGEGEGVRGPAAAAAAAAAGTGS